MYRNLPITIMTKMKATRYIEPIDIGAGSHGSVRKHYDTKLGIPVAIKIAKSRFAKSEAKMLSFVAGKCDYIPNLYKVEIDANDGVSIVMEYAPGTTLSKHELSADRRAVFSVFKCVTKAVKSIHAFGVIHRDIKPDNIVVNLFPLSVKLVDWGFACLVTDKIQTRCRMGTPLYSAPELYYKVPYVDMANDIWSLGVSLFETLTKRFPHDVEEGRDQYSRFVNVLLLNHIDYTGIDRIDKTIYESIFIHYTFRLEAEQLLDDMSIMEKASMTND